MSGRDGLEAEFQKLEAEIAARSCEHRWIETTTLGSARQWSCMACLSTTDEEPE